MFSIFFNFFSIKCPCYKKHNPQIVILQKSFMLASKASERSRMISRSNKIQICRILIINFFFVRSTSKAEFLFSTFDKIFILQIPRPLLLISFPTFQIQNLYFLKKKLYFCFQFWRCGRWQKIYFDFMPSLLLVMHFPIFSGKLTAQLKLVGKRKKCETIGTLFFNSRPESNFWTIAWSIVSMA